MDEQEIINKINNIFEEENIDIEVSDIADIENFLNDEDNMDLEVYEVVEQLYSQLIEDADFVDNELEF